MILIHVDVKLSLNGEYDDWLGEYSAWHESPHVVVRTNGRSVDLPSP